MIPARSRGLLQTPSLGTALPGPVCSGEVPGTPSLGFPIGAVVDVSSADQVPSWPPEGGWG